MCYVVESQGVHGSGVTEVDEGVYNYRRRTYELEDAEETEA